MSQKGEAQILAAFNAGGPFCHIGDWVAALVCDDGWSPSKRELAALAAGRGSFGMIAAYRRERNAITRGLRARVRVARN